MSQTEPPSPSTSSSAHLEPVPIALYLVSEDTVEPDPVALQQFARAVVTPTGCATSYEQAIK